MNFICFRRTKETNHPQILFKLDDDLFIFSSDNCLSVLSSLRLNEVINYYKNMSTMAVPLKTLEKNIPVRAEYVFIYIIFKFRCRSLRYSEGEQTFLSYCFSKRDDKLKEVSVCDVSAGCLTSFSSLLPGKEKFKTFNAVSR